MRLEETPEFEELRLLIRGEVERIAKKIIADAINSFDIEEMRQAMRDLEATTKHPKHQPNPKGFRK